MTRAARYYPPAFLTLSSRMDCLGCRCKVKFAMSPSVPKSSWSWCSLYKHVIPSPAFIPWIRQDHRKHGVFRRSNRIIAIRTCNCNATLCKREARGKSPQLLGLARRHVKPSEPSYRCHRLEERPAFDSSAVSPFDHISGQIA